LATLIRSKNRSEEARVRQDLAACYRLAAHFQWDDLISTHISARVPGEEAFLINPFGLMFEEITPDSLVKIDLDGNIIGETEWSVNAAGFVVHSAVHQARHEAECVIHLHTPAGMAVSMLEEGYLPWTISAALFAEDIAYHDVEGVADRLDERERLQASLGTKNLMILRNHGTMALGPSVAEAFTAMWHFEKACQTQIMALSTGRQLRPMPDDVIKGCASYRKDGRLPVSEPLVWPAMMRLLDRTYPGWRG
jgi:ribulose-5-phosphate 4-epimerase/fuculose-1-phosphate aldolase